MPLVDKKNLNEVDSNEIIKQNDIIDIDIASVKKTRIRINGDNNQILYLNLSDMYIGERLEKGYEQLQKNVQKITQLSTDENSNFSEQLHEIDKDMRDLVDGIFDANVSEICCKDGTMYDIKDGEFRFEGILEKLTQLYSTTLTNEYKNLKKRLQQKADKYLPQDHKPKATKKRKEIIQKDE